MPVTQLADQYLDTYATGGEIPGGLAFRKALTQVNLDFTPDSLARIDRLLDQIRAQLKPQFDAFIGVQENQNFLYLLCFYAGVVVSRYTGRKIEWYQYPELMRLMPDLGPGFPQCFATSMTCVFEDGNFFVPLGSIQERLIEEGSGRSLLESADKFMRRVSGSQPMLVRPEKPQAAASGPLPQALARTAELAGFAAAFNVYVIAEGASLVPMLSQEMPSGEKGMVSLMYDSSDDAITEGLRRLEKNGDGAVRSALVYDGFINLPRFRTDTLALEVRCYKPQAIAFSIGLPYRHARHESGFAIYNPRLLSFSLDETHRPLLFASFFAGFDQFKPAGLWNQYFDGSA
jgi:hypothetical protein